MFKMVNNDVVIAYVEYIIFFIYIYQEPTDIPSRKKLMRWVCARGLVCQKREFTVRSSSCEVMIRSKKMEHEAFILLKLFCFQSIFLLLKLLLFAKN